MFTNPIIGGNNTLIRTSIKSPDYTPGVSGWTINKDGTAEFNDVTVRGELLVSDPDGSYVRVYDEDPGDGALIEMGLPTSVGLTRTPARLYTSPALPVFGVPGIRFVSPTVNGTPEAALTLIADTNNDLSTVVLTGTNMRASVSSDIGIFGPQGIELNTVGGTGDVTVNTGTDRRFRVVGTGSSSYMQGDLQIGPDSTVVSRGWIAGGGITASNAVVTNAEVVQLTALNSAGGTPTFRAGRAYRVVVNGGVTTSNTANQPVWRLRKTNTAGAQFDVWRSSCMVAGQTYPASYETRFRCNPAADVSANMVITLAAPAGINMQLTGAGSSPATVDIYEDGPADNTIRNWLPILT